MADGGVDIDLYGDDLNEGFNQNEEFPGGDPDLYDDVLAAPSNTSNQNGQDNANASVAPIDRLEPSETNGGGYQGGHSGINHIPRRHQLYVGNLTWWTTDQDITDAVGGIGVTDFQEVKFFENRANGQSKGFCVISLGSEQSMRMVMERFSKKELHGQNPVVTLPTKQALNNFEAQQKTRPTPPTTQGGPRGPAPGMQGPPPGMQGPPQGPPQGMPRMMNPNGPPGPFRPGFPGMQGNMNMQGPPGMPPRMPPGMNQGMPMQQQGPPRFPNQGQWNGPPRPNGPMRPNMGPGGPPQRPMFQGPGGPRGPWNGPMQGPQGFPPGGRPPHMQGPPRGPVPPQMGGPMGPGQGGPAPHVNPAFFNQNAGPGGPMPQHGGGNAPPPQHFNQSAPRGPWPPTGAPKPANPSFNDAPVVPATPLSEVEFEEIMTRNRTVSSSAIARAVSDAAAGEYSSAIETLVTAISLIKQSKVAHDERCKILISSLQDTLHGIESKSYSRRERSRSRDRSHRRGRRDRSASRDRYKEKRYSRERSRDRERDRDRDSRYHSESDRRERDGGREKSRSRDRAAAGDYRDDGRHHSRPRNKSPEAPNENATDSSSKRNYYDDRYRSSDRERDRDRERREEHRSRH